jgi:hypothetical protein
MEALKRQAALRDALLDRIKSALSADERVLGAWLSGSFGRGEDDEWSDYDLHVAVEDSCFESFLQDREALYGSVGEPILVQHEMASDNLTLGGGVYQLVYFAGGIMVDWNYGPASRGLKPTGHKIIFERRAFQVAVQPILTHAERLQQAQKWTTFFWSMAPIAIKYAGRGWTRQGARQTDLLTRALICLKRLLSISDGPDPWLEWMNRPLEPEIRLSLPALGEVITPPKLLDMIKEQCSLMSDMHEQLSRLGVDVHPAMLTETERLMELASALVGGDINPHGKT